MGENERSQAENLFSNEASPRQVMLIGEEVVPNEDQYHRSIRSYNNTEY